MLPDIVWKDPNHLSYINLNKLNMNMNKEPNWSTVHEKVMMLTISCLRSDTYSPP